MYSEGCIYVKVVKKISRERECGKESHGNTAERVKVRRIT